MSYTAMRFMRSNPTASDSLPAGSFKTRFDKAYAEFSKLEGVDDDPARIDTVSDLVFIAQFEIDLVESGESTINITPHRKFVRKWS